LCRGRSGRTRTGGCDAARISVSTVANVPRLQTLLIWPDPLDFVVGNSHPLAMEPRIGIAALAQHRAIMPARGTVTREILDKALLPHNLRLQIKMESNYLETIKMMVSVGLGWSLLPRSMGQGLTGIAVEGLYLRRRLGVAWQKKRSLSNAAQSFIDCCRSQLG